MSPVRRVPVTGFAERQPLVRFRRPVPQHEETIEFAISLTDDSSWVGYLYETRLLADLFAEAWARDEIVSVSRAAVDSGGYDVVVQREETERFVQVKQVTSTSSTSKIHVHVLLEKRPSGCVVVVRHGPSGARCAERGLEFAVFGGPAGTPLDLRGFSPAAKARSGHLPEDQKLKKNTVLVPLARLTWLSVDELYDFLFDDQFILPADRLGRKGRKRVPH